MKIVSGFERPDHGQVLIDGAPLLRPNAKGIVISQHRSVFPSLSARPAVIQATFAVPQPHPRKLSSRALQTLQDAILAALGL